MRRWDESKISDFWQQSRTFLWLPVFNNNNTTEVSGKVFLCTSNVVKNSTPAGRAYSAPRPLTGGEKPVCYNELWLCISKLLDLIMIGWRLTDYVAMWLKHGSDKNVIGGLLDQWPRRRSTLNPPPEGVKWVHDVYMPSDLRHGDESYQSCHWNSRKLVETLF